MSGGSWDYVSYKIDEVADRLIAEHSTPLRVALGRHLKLVADAMHDIEWNDSGDGADTEEENIRKVLDIAADHMIMDVLIEDAKSISNKLNKEIERAEQANKDE